MRTEMTSILVIILILVIIGALPGWGYTEGYGPSGIVGLMLVVLLILIATGRL